jgi:type IV pilus secretin PilQ/predicted competence protein
MRGKTYLRVLSVLGALSLVCGFAVNADSPPIKIDQISVESGILHTKVVLESASPLAILGSQYLEGTSPKLVIDLDKVTAQQTSDLKIDKNSLVSNIKVEDTGQDVSRLIFDLKERVPYRIYSDPEGTVIEFNRYQNGQKDYVLDPVLKTQIESQPMPSSYLKDIHVEDQSGRVDIVAELTDQTLSHVFVLNDPLRLVVDLHNTLYTRNATNYSINKLGVQKVRTAQFQLGDPYTITRMVFDLDRPQLYSVDTQGDSLTVSFFDKVEGKAAPPEEPKTEEPKVEAAPDPQPEPEKQPEPPAAAEADPPVTGAPPPTVVEPEPKSVPKEVPLPTIVEQPAEQDPESEQTSQYQPKTIASQQSDYKGEIITMRFHEADLQGVVIYLAEFAGLNVTFDPGVTGIVSVSLVEVPWDQALDLILKQNKMGKVVEGNILRIAPMSVLTRERDDIRRLEESEELSGPLVTRTFWLSYSRAPDVQALLTSKISTRGEIIIDNRTNTLTITDVEDRMAILESMIEVFDTPTPQVSIEARIVEATSTFIRNLGIQWGFNSIQDPFYGNQTSLKFPNRVLVDGSLIPQGIVTKGIAGPLGGYAINLPAPAFTTAAGISFANVLDTFRLDMALTALETSGSGKIISAPKITTQNNQEANIVQGRQIPVQTVANFTVTTRYVNAALELRATPQITAEGTIIMYIEIQNNAADFANLVNGIPPITTQSASTTVMVPDGGTTVIGGIYRTEDSITREKVPLLHKIPILGNLFKSFARTKQNRELLIFITPRIIK